MIFEKIIEKVINRFPQLPKPKYWEKHGKKRYYFNKKEEDKDFTFFIVKYNAIGSVSGCMDDLKFMRADRNEIAVIKLNGTIKKISLLVIVSRPGRPVILSIDKVFADLMQSDVASRFLLDYVVAANMIAMTVGVDDQRYITQFNP